MNFTGKHTHVLCICLSMIPFVTGSTPVTGPSQERGYLGSVDDSHVKDDSNIGFDIFSMIDPWAFTQTHSEAFIGENLSGSGINIGIIDGGFAYADTAARLQHHFAGNRIGGTNNYLNPGSEQFFTVKDSEADFHGSVVWHLIGGYNPGDSSHIGTAIGATYYLASTDAPGAESRTEEKHWAQALEWLRSNDVKLVNSSLTYSTGYDNPAENYLPEQMDGQTTLTAKAAFKAAEANMILVVAAGNEGDDEEWQIVSSPADVEGVITVGATDREGLRATMSSVGSAYTPYLKPDVACYGFSGTSTAAPVITGLIACMLQKDATMSPARVKDILVRSASLYPFPNNYLGYGVPDARKILTIMNGEKITYNAREVSAKDTFTIEGVTSYDHAIRVFHKSGAHRVSSQELHDQWEGSLVIRRPSEKITRTTIAGDGFVREVIWQ